MESIVWYGGGHGAWLAWMGWILANEVGAPWKTASYFTLTRREENMVKM